MPRGAVARTSNQSASAPCPCTRTRSPTVTGAPASVRLISAPPRLDTPPGPLAARQLDDVVGGKPHPLHEWRRHAHEALPHVVRQRLGCADADDRLFLASGVPAHRTSAPHSADTARDRVAFLPPAITMTAEGQWGPRVTLRTGIIGCRSCVAACCTSLTLLHCSMVNCRGIGQTIGQTITL